MRYKEYKKVDLPWLEEMPGHWEIKRIASVFDIRKEKNDPIKTEEVLSLSAKYGVTPYSKKKEKGGNKPKSDLTKYNLCYRGDILVNCMNVVAGAVGISNYFGAVSPVYYPLVTNKYNNKYYMEYLFRNYDFQRGMVGLGKGIMMNESESGNLTTVRMRISWDTLKTLEVSVPPKEEQEQIARFLDWKINEIDRVIDKKEKRKRYINKLKKTYISDIINKICEEDDLTRLNLKIILKPKTIRKIDIQEEVKLLSVVREKGVIIRDLSQDSTNHNPIPEDLSNYKVVRKNDFVMNKMKAWQGSYGISKYDGVVSPAYYVFELFLSENILLPDYFNLSIRTQRYIDEFNKNSKGIRTGQWDFPVDKLADIDFILPSIENQKKILLIIERIKLNLNSLEINIYTQIKKLQQLKQSLISDVVTGKIDVRNIDIPDYDKVSDVEDGAI